MTRARLREIAITQAISIVSDASVHGRPLGEPSDALIELLECLRAERPFGKPERRGPEE
jgi:hypothetical protein